MKKIRVIENDALPVRAPLASTVIWWLLLDRFHAPGWAWGAMAVLAALLWIGFVIRWCVQVEGKLPGFGEK